MRLAVISDIHGNLVALETALADLEATQPDIVWCLGDLAAAGPRPAECIRRIRAAREAFGEKKFHVIGGNADRYMVTGERFPVPPVKDEASFKGLADGWQQRDTTTNWGVSQIAYEDYEYLAKIIGQEVALEVEGYGWVIGYHAVPGNDETQIKPDTPEEEVLDALLDREGRLAVGGHIHVQMDRDLGNWRVVNVGSVGFSLDMPGKAQWGLFTFEHGAVTVDLRAVPYDVAAVLADLETVGHPTAEWVINRFKLQQT
jgi:predicted phosphodiesterase